MAIAWRVAEVDHTFTGLSNEARTLVPKKAMNEIQRLAGEAGEDGQIEFARDDSHLFFQVGQTPADFTYSDRAIPQLRSGTAARQQ